VGASGAPKAKRPLVTVTEQPGGLRVSAARYQLEFPTDRPFVFLNTPAGERIAELFVASGVHPLHDREDTLSLAGWQAASEDEDGAVVVTARASSSVWAEKVLRFRCFDQRLEYDVAVTGIGRMSEVTYFGGYYSGQPRWGSGFFRSGQRFQQGFNPEPTTAEHYHFAPGAGATIDLMGVPLPGKASWFFTPPPFCFAFETEAGWLGLGVQATPGAHYYTEYHYAGQADSFNLSLHYEGHTAVDGHYQLPAIGFDFAQDPYSALAAHIAASPPVAPAAQPPAAWWSEPIFCGWGAQCYLARDSSPAPDLSRQANYEGFLAALAAHDLNPGIVVLDDKWQATYGDNAVDPAKWPDLPGFIRDQHAAGRRVLLWLKAWDFEGLPVDECITNAAGAPVSVDPAHPRYRQRLAGAVERMLSAAGYDADGFKLDFTARIPSGPGLRHHGPAWGLELMRSYLDLLYQSAKRAKPDALVMTHTPHPYLAGSLDMIRLNDVNTGRPVLPAMQHRARLARLACPSALIDTDNWPMPDRAAWREYVAHQPELGVPSLYCATHIDSTGEPLEAEDYALLRDTWARHRANVRAGHQP
jgi:hypothetical protein